MRMPTRKIRAAHQSATAIVASSVTSERAISHAGTGVMRILMGISTGEKNGMVVRTTASGSRGAPLMIGKHIEATMSTIMTGICACWASRSESFAAPMAAKIDE